MSASIRPASTHSARDPVDTRQFSRPSRELRVLLAEGIHDNAVRVLRDAGFEHIETHPTALSEDALIDGIGDVHYLGIRSRTRVTPRVLEAARELRSIGCFCIGTNQVDTEAAKIRGIPVFNAPFSNTRSVAELVLAEAVLLLRDIPRKNASAHRGCWLKTAAGSYEVRGKHLGIVGYGHIGSQVGLLAEALGMRVFFYDVQSKLALGNATSCGSLNGLLEVADVVTLHVPEAPETRNMIAAGELGRMRPGAALINASRGSVVDIDALVDALESKHLSGAALDVFPSEPKASQEEFVSPLRGLDNVILTPHVGGSTEEAQHSIGLEVAEKLARFNANGTTLSAVNFPEVSLPPHLGTYRLLHIHRNQPGVMANVNAIFSESGINIAGEYLQTDDKIGYVVVDFDVDEGFDTQRLERLKAIDGTLRARIVAR
ncbi:MAG: phosphoglycerate dehydrogenase [Gammaproteobacteria bacterium]|nr:phosphoglycerate dehydrogenase [Gammaproteobacteria bacterium]NIN39594.1 phosphoglycerate dehydrogenase [Gammaproteobacteria bacterium]NIO25151.1 phosphoglycerate dehydrogenase [Gammaproteobacteria bacterium]NIO65780.1 phosphoglycerate dehydrogenase [Gammaproteobacteria bacterium]NIP45783.1 phosphoglycerate dehydrogenase [Gammaproteobacteria bacterium]